MTRLIQYMRTSVKLLFLSGLFLFSSGLFAQGEAGMDLPPALAVSATKAATMAPAPATQPASAAQPASVTRPSPVPTSTPPTTANNAVVVSAPAESVAASIPGMDSGTQVELIDPMLFGTTQDPSFQNMTTKMFPMTPDQIAALRQVYESTQSAISAPPASPKPMLSSQTVPLSPGSVPPVIRLATGYVSSVLFLDETGMPWPITSYNMGDPKSFNVQWDQESNMLMIQGQGPYSTGNMAVTLEDLNTPMMFTLVSDQRVVDYRVDFRVQGRGPNAAGSLNANSAKTGSALLMNLLDGVAPQDARSLEVVGGTAQAWVRGSTMFLRTPLTVLSPSWDATMSSADGTKVYQMNATPLVLVSDRGRSTTITIKGL